jgi:hypothetical protein
VSLDVQEEEGDSTIIVRRRSSLRTMCESPSFLLAHERHRPRDAKDVPFEREPLLGQCRTRAVVEESNGDMAITREAVEAFLAAPKRVVARGGEIRWTAISLDSLRWRAPVEVEATAQGMLWLLVNRSLPRTWNFKLELRGEAVSMWHFKPLVHHRNIGCPDDFPKRVRGEHEHVWIEGRGMDCARPLKNLGSSSHEQVLRSFCERTNIDLQAVYRAPGEGEQLVLETPEAEA